MAVIMANYGSPTGGWTPAGRSAIWDNVGTLLAVAGETGDALVIAKHEHGNWSGETVSV